MTLFSLPHRIVESRESGLFEFWIKESSRHWFTTERIEELRPESHFEEINMAHLAGVFLMIVIGLALTTLGTIAIHFMRRCNLTSKLYQDRRRVCSQNFGVCAHRRVMPTANKVSRRRNMDFNLCAHKQWTHSQHPGSLSQIPPPIFIPLSSQEREKQQRVY